MAEVIDPTLVSFSPITVVSEWRQLPGPWCLFKVRDTIEKYRLYLSNNGTL